MAERVVQGRRAVSEFLPDAVYFLPEHIGEIHALHPALKPDRTFLGTHSNFVRVQSFPTATLALGCGADGSCNYVSRPWAEYTGFPEQQHFGYHWLEAVHPEERERLRADWSAAVKSGSSFNTEFRLLSRAHGGNAYRWFRARAVPIRDEQGIITKWYLTAIDVDDLRQATAAQREAAERLETVLEGIDDAFIALDGTLTVTYFNAAAERMFARARGQVVGKRFVDVFPEAAGSLLASKLEEARKRQGVLSFQTELGDAGRQSSYAVRLRPFSAGISVFCQRAEASGHAPPGDSA